MTHCDISEFLDGFSELPILDVRSPSEFLAGHIPGAFNLPVFDDKERAEIGVLYKQEGSDRAVKLGETIATPKITELIAQASKHGNEIRIHCWRGGMRSQRTADLLNSYGFNCHVLRDGYKAYRGVLSKFFSGPMNLIVLTGNTGSMKTEVLHALEELGEQVIDLEGLACHQGSSFGNVQSPGQPTTEQFQNDLFEQFRSLDLSKRIWIEDESKVIGKVVLPDALFERKQISPHVLIKVSREKRLDHLVSNYGGLSRTKLIKGTEGVRRKLGNQNCDRAIEYIEKRSMREACDIILGYYDKTYNKSLEKKRTVVDKVFEFDREEPTEIARHLQDGA